MPICTITNMHNTSSSKKCERDRYQELELIYFNKRLKLRFESKPKIIPTELGAKTAFQNIPVKHSCEVYHEFSNSSFDNLLRIDQHSCLNIGYACQTTVKEQNIKQYYFISELCKTLLILICDLLNVREIGLVPFHQKPVIQNILKLQNVLIPTDSFKNTTGYFLAVL